MAKSDNKQKRKLRNYIDRELARNDYPDDLSRYDEKIEMIFGKIERELDVKERYGFRRFKKVLSVGKFAAAAIVLVLLGIGWVWLNSSSGNEGADGIQLVDVSERDVLPGTDRATLRLDDGRLIDLDGLPVGDTLYHAGGAYVKGASGEVTYVAESRAFRDHSPVRFSTISTPNGGQFKVVLPDGSQVWLNAASTLTYPDRFDGEERIVELTGEAYFEVKSLPGTDLKNVPFRVISAGQEVAVLGTRFNVSAYADDRETVTTLVSGKVRVIRRAEGNRNEPRRVVLRPNQQSVVSNEDTGIRVIEVDPASAIAWKEGDFRFQNEPIESIMRKLARWYDFEVEYAREFGDLRFSGMLARSRNLSAVLNMLQSTGEIQFKITADGEKGRRLVMM